MFSLYRKDSEPFASGNLNKKDLLIACLFFIVAFIVRLPDVATPITIMDEGLYIGYISHEIKGVPFFDNHPPLGRIMMGSMVFSYISLSNKFTGPSKPITDFPFLNIRLFNIVAGAMTVSLFYLFGKMFFTSSSAAVIPTIFLTFDNLHVLFSRMIVPDVWLWFFGILGLFAFALALNPDTRKPELMLVLAGVIFGCAVSVKWTGISFLAVSTIWLLNSGAWRKATIICLVAFFSYTLIFTTYLMRFEPGFVGGGHLYPMADYVDDLYFPPRGDWTSLFKLLSEYNLYIYKVQSDLSEADTIFAGRPQEWPLSLAPFAIKEVTGNTVVALGNIFTWTLALLALAVSGFRSVRYFQNSKKNAGVAFFPLFGFVVSFLPFLFVGRNMYIYSYIPALMFAFLSVPYLFSGGTLSKLSTRVTLGLAFVAVCSFAIFSNLTYGF